ncbi:hypothetical protein HKBW3S09_01525 [Candidatus Hakubella thermalkaliphila]|uniref:Uncharacterized protein n=2 Tax=Candidatus Hakubella thermalkaliphila TaxID=2754717 RepID=A0A6V8NUV6_9ACTN|nr:hypothetical protein HKBW3S09_01525 [Candidatus Hakubella thermalkaliphila]
MSLKRVSLNDPLFCPCFMGIYVSARIMGYKEMGYFIKELFSRYIITLVEEIRRERRARREAGGTDVSKH